MKNIEAERTRNPKRRCADRPIATRSDKIQSVHLDRLAIVYVRQSTPQQVRRCTQSTEVQYDLEDRALALGWPKENVLVIDDDLGTSATSSSHRPGFQRLVTEVTMDHVGIVLGVQMSRLARSCKDWYHLLDLCGVYRTLIADLDGIYAPWLHNDRLLLGLKGAMAEAETHIIQQRMYTGLLKKAERCEMFCCAPTGYMRRLSGEVTFDPDEQVQHVVRLIFRKFKELGTVNAVLDYLVANNIQMGFRLRVGSQKGSLEWRRPTRGTIRDVLRNPIYAGAYAFGRRRVDPKRKKPDQAGSGRVELPMDQWHVLEKDRLPAYISWQEFEVNLKRINENRSRSESRGAPRKGAALLSGLLICRRCGRRMMPQYATSQDYYRYWCHNARVHHGDPICQSLSGVALDAQIEKLVLATLQPAGLDVSIRATENIEQERAEANRLWEQRLERSDYEVDRARRQYDFCEPEHRLVARQLEKEWEKNLSERSQLRQEYERFRLEKPKHLSDEEKGLIRQLATDIPALWNDAATTVDIKKAILREVVETIAVDVVGNSEKVNVAIKWAGGHETEATVIRPVASLVQLSYYPELVDRFRTLAREGQTAKEIADCLNAEGFVPPKRTGFFKPISILRLGARLRIQITGTARKRQDPLNAMPVNEALVRTGHAVALLSVEAAKFL
jgi:DNA invertase Pin-like site-specific DNA recombinase